eukprot:scaffold65784_cov60-Phaeocystis_antarctica.AAC.3
MHRYGWGPRGHLCRALVSLARHRGLDGAGGAPHRRELDHRRRAIGQQTSCGAGGRAQHDVEAASELRGLAVRRHEDAARAAAASLLHHHAAADRGLRRQLHDEQRVGAGHHGGGPDVARRQLAPERRRLQPPCLQVAALTSLAEAEVE